MKDNSNRKNHGMKPHQDSKTRFEVIPVMAEVHVPTEADFVKIPVSEFMGLVANNALLETVKRVISQDAYGYYTSLRNMLGVTKEKEEK